MTNLINQKQISFVIPGNKAKERIDIFLANSIENATRTRIQKLISEGLVLVNGKKTKSNYQVLPNDKIEVTIPISPRPDIIFHVIWQKNTTLNTNHKYNKNNELDYV